MEVILTDRCGMSKSTLHGGIAQLEPISPKNEVRDRVRYSNGGSVIRYEAGPMKEFNFDFFVGDNK